MKANTRRTRNKKQQLQEAAAPSLSLSLSVHFSSQQEVYNKAFSDV
jgi:hypothetical protein